MYSEEEVFNEVKSLLEREYKIDFNKVSGDENLFENYIDSFGYLKLADLIKQLGEKLNIQLDSELLMTEGEISLNSLVKFVRSHLQVKIL